MADDQDLMDVDGMYSNAYTLDHFNIESSQY